MTLDEYQQAANKTAQYPDGLNYTALGLAGEAGEFCDKLKKVKRDKGGVLSINTKIAMLQELGDVLWYVSQNARELGYDLEMVANMNIDKLRSRQERGVLGGSGDER